MLIFNYRIKDNSLGKTNKNGGVNNGKGKKRKYSNDSIDSSNVISNNRSKLCSL